MFNNQIFSQIKIIFIIPLLVSCDYISDLKRTGDIVSKEIEWNGATHIEIAAPVRIIPVVSDESKIRLTGMDFIVEGYQFIETEEKLIVEHKKINRLQEEKIADLFLYTPKFERFTVNAPCKFDGKDTLFFDKLTIIINGSGANTMGSLTLKGNGLHFFAFGINKCRLNFSGEIHSASYKIQGGTVIDALELKTVNSSIEQRSFGDFYVFATGLLSVRIYSSGNVYYKGNPETDFEIVKNNLLNSSGKMLKIE